MSESLVGAGQVQICPKSQLECSAITGKGHVDQITVIT
jgi:hypothetical protein